MIDPQTVEIIVRITGAVGWILFFAVLAKHYFHLERFNRMCQTVRDEAVDLARRTKNISRSIYK